ncbi:hypothetical protein [Natrinema sp. SYSU A 869]|uniref:DUF7509 family protein n=1 Tax=Natrinema sp. SYSU A 869 TaxID=2871694 RepID=UPI0021025800|nr:hypothetical protein [Natrinema sp. SYSU A 869]
MKVSQTVDRHRHELTRRIARASNAVVYVIPAAGDTLGVGIEVGSVLESLFDEDAAAHQERVAFAHELGRPKRDDRRCPRPLGRPDLLI